MKNAEILESNVSVSTQGKLKNKAFKVPDKNSVESSLYQLDLITQRMRRSSIFIFSLTLFNTFFPVVIFSGAIYFFIEAFRPTVGFSNGIVNGAITLWITLLFTTLVLIYIYESLRKRGEVLFEEISDELEWNVRGQGLDEVADERPEIGVRVSLRSFAKTTDLPLIPGKFGPAIYLAFNVLVPLFIGSKFLFRF